jgi:hypothetical protein
METLMIIGFMILGLILLIGLLRVLNKPYTGLDNFIIEILLLDWLADVFKGIGDSDWSDGDTDWD